MKRGDLEKLREKQYHENQKKLEEERLAKKKKSNGSLDDGGIGGIGEYGNGNKSGKKNHEDEEDDLNMAPEVVIKKLRSRDQPIRLFGETDKERIKRFKNLQIKEEQMGEGGDDGGQRNDFRKALAHQNEALALENLKKKGEEETSQDTSEQTRVKKQDEKDDSIDTTIISLELLKENLNLTYDLIGIYFARMMREWEKFLSIRPDDVRRTHAGKLQSAMQTQSSEYMKPFFKGLKNRTIPPDVVARLAEICQLMQQREYLIANDRYLQMSIGNAPWPIGVTMVGIHERSGREKIFASQIAHVLNDETQRKWIQSIKRLMTFAQIKYPPSDRAKMVG